MYPQIKRAFMASLLFLVCIFANAQKTITGNVKDANGEPLIGVTVSVGNSNTGAITDIDGKFTLSNVSPSTTLNVSYVGYKTQAVRVGNQASINIVLQEDNTTLEDVVVIGYGTMKRRDLTGAVASVSGDKLAQNPVSNIAEALQGQLPGVNVLTQDGRPDAQVSIRVRGGGSITQSNDPLFIVDGIQVSSINDIPADNIESIDVLKDGASTAIYGARGANGVILVTTKGAKEGRATVKYNMYYQTKSAPETLEVMDAYDYVSWLWGYATAYGASYGDNIAKYFGLGPNYGNHLNDYKNVKSHNYMDDVLKNSNTWNHDLSLTGGSQHTRYYATVNYTNDDGIRLKSGFKRWNANFKFSQDITKNLKFDTDIRYSEIQYRGTRWGYASSVYNYRPIDNPLGVDLSSGLFGNSNSVVEAERSPLALIDNYDALNKTYRLRANSGLTWNLFKGLTAKSEVTLSRYWRDQKSWDGGLESNGINQASLTKTDGYDVRWTTTLNYEIQGLGEDHSLSVLLGNEVLAAKSQTTSLVGAGYPEEWGMDQAFASMSFTTPSYAKDSFNNSFSVPTHTQSWFGRLNYSYLGRYLLSATMRADGSSKFSPNNHWGYFPSAAAAWRISDEPFMESTKGWLDNLKLRLSYGTAGADNISANLWQATWESQQKAVDGVTKTIFVPGSMMPNPDLKWETTTSRNIGFDFGFWNGKLRGTLDIYWNTTSDLLMKVPIDSSSGYSYQYQNVGQTSNKGIELALNYEIFRSKDFTLSFGATYNFNKNNVDELYEGVNTDTATGWGSTMKKPYYDYIIREGKPVGVISGMKSLGYYTLDDFDYRDGLYYLKAGVPDIQEVVNYAYGDFKRPAGQTAIPGMVKFEDTDKNGVVDLSDAVELGETQAKHTGGFSFSGRYKSLDFSANFTYQIGGKVYNANVMHDMMGNKDNQFGNRLAEVAQTWKIYNADASGNMVVVTDPSALAALNANAKYALPYSEYGIVSSDFIEDASFLRLQTLTIGYTLPKTWLKSIGITNLRVYATGSNLFCLTGYSGLDPEINTNSFESGNFPTPGYDYQAYPKARSFTFGLNVTF